MRTKLRTPSTRRARRWGKGLGTLGTLVGTVAGSLPIGATARKRRGPNPAKLVLPITGGAALVGVLAKRRRSSRSGADSGFTPSPYSAEPAAATGVEGGTAPGPVVVPSVTAPPVDPLVPTDAVDTATEQAKVEAVAGPGVEGVIATPREAAGETPASSFAGEVPRS